MELASPATALSPAVKHLMCSVGCTGHRETEEKGQAENETSPSDAVFITSDGDLDFDRLASLLPTQYSSPKYYEQAVSVLAKVFVHCQCTLMSLGEESIHTKLLPKLRWTLSEQIWCDCLSMLREQNESRDKDVLVILLLTASLERALGNVFLLQGSQCPSMLKDLLVTAELTSTLGDSVMQLLKVVIGPPTSLNLRNVAWHGFLGDGELPSRYNCFLVLLTTRIGHVLKEKGITDIPQRPYFVWTPAVKSRLHTALQLLDCLEERLDLVLVRQLLKESLMIQPQTERQWHLALQLYEQGSYGYCLALLLPLLEHCLRRAFATVNNCPHRVLTAESSAFYTTFNEMLEQMLPDGMVNQLPAFLTTPCMDLLHDLLFYPEGPRVRDHLSHGEVDFAAVDQEIVFPFLCVVIFLAHRLCRESSLFTSTAFFKKIVERVQCYRSVFHPIAILQQKFSYLLDQLEKTESFIIVSASLELLQEGAGMSGLCEDNRLLSRTQDEILPLWQSDTWTMACPLSIAELANGVNVKLEPLKQLSQQHIPTLFRWQGESGQPGTMRESEFVGLLLRITEECTFALEQTQQTLQQRQKQLMAKELRSRQRENLKKLLVCVPCLQMLVAVLSATVGWNIQHLDSFSSFTPQQCRLLQKHLKVTLQQCENLRTLTSIDKNKWTESVELILTWIPKCCHFLTQFQLLSA